MDPAAETVVNKSAQRGPRALRFGRRRRYSRWGACSIAVGQGGRRRAGRLGQAPSVSLKE